MSEIYFINKSTEELKTGTCELGFEFAPISLLLHEVAVRVFSPLCGRAIKLIRVCRESACQRMAGSVLGVTLHSAKTQK